MKNIKGFIKLFDLNIPSIDDFDYYIHQLSKTPKFENIYQLIDMYEKIEDDIIDINGFKMDKSKEVIDFIKSTVAYTDMCYDHNLLDLPTNKSFQYEENKIYLSVDIISANWNSIKKYDYHNELGESYKDLLSKFDMPIIFSESKYLRQFIFGNVNPKKQQKVQRNIIQNIIRDYTNLTIECVKNDEVVFSLNDFSDSLDILSTIDNNKFKTKIFKISRVEDFRINHYFDNEGNELNKEMFGVNGQEFYLKLKQYITNEELDIKDLVFIQNGKKAVWYNELKSLI